MDMFDMVVMNQVGPVIRHDTREQNNYRLQTKAAKTAATVYTD